MRRDKWLHLLAGALIALSVGVLLSPMLGLLMAAGIGAIKEMYDAMHPLEHTADVWDFVATVAGGCMGAICLIYV